jgi:hypothetical protein
MGRVHAWKLHRSLFEWPGWRTEKHEARSVGGSGWGLSSNAPVTPSPQQPCRSIFEAADLLLVATNNTPKNMTLPLRFDISDPQLSNSGPLGCSTTTATTTTTGATTGNLKQQESKEQPQPPQFICRVLAQSSEEGIRGIYIAPDGAILSVEGDLQTRVWASVRDSRAQLLRFKRPHSYSICVNTFSLQKAGVCRGSGDAGPTQNLPAHAVSRFQNASAKFISSPRSHVRRARRCVAAAGRTDFIFFYPAHVRA